MHEADRAAEFTGRAVTPQAVWLELLHGRVQQIADDADLRTLVIKGAFASQLGLRQARTSMDVDVLVPAAAHDALVEGMATLGWLRRPVDPSDDVFPQHSTSLYHPKWPVDVDVHYRFPGLDGDDAEVFEALWREHVTHPAAGIQVRTTGPVATTVILAVNALRAPSSARSLRDLEELVRLAPTIVAGGDVVAMATATGALAAARPFLEEAFPEHCPAQWPRPSRTWNLYSLNSESASHRLIALRHASPKEWPVQVWRALFPSRTALAATNLNALTADRRELCRLRWRRLARVLHKVPTVIGSYREFRRRERGR